MNQHDMRKTIQDNIDKSITNFISIEDLTIPGRLDASGIAETVQSLDCSPNDTEFLAIIDDGFIIRSIVAIGRVSNPSKTYWVVHDETFLARDIISGDRNYATDPVHVAAKLTELLYRELEFSSIARLTDLLAVRAAEEYRE